LNPGATTRPSAVRRSRASCPGGPATSTIRPSRTATLPWREGAPVPSTIRAFFDDQVVHVGLPDLLGAFGSESRSAVAG